MSSRKQSRKPTTMRARGGNVHLVEWITYVAEMKSEYPRFKRILQKKGYQGNTWSAFLKHIRKNYDDWRQ